MSSTTTTPPNPPADAPGVPLFPPVIPLGMLAAGFALQRVVPIGLLASIPLPWRIGAGLAIFASGVFVAASASRAMRRHGTNVLPTRPSLAIVADGVFARTRNPIYVGNFIALAGVSVIAALDWVIPLYVPGALLLHYGVVLREERYLERKFGDAYRTYMARTPRYI